MEDADADAKAENNVKEGKKENRISMDIEWYTLYIVRYDIAC